MYEGILSLMQMAKLRPRSRLDDKKYPLFLFWPTRPTGGTAASFATLGDAIIAEPGAMVGFAGPGLSRRLR